MDRFSWQRLTEKMERWEQRKLDSRTIYGLVDPRNGMFYYVGATVDLEGRMKSHLSKSSHNAELQTWIDDLAAEGLKPDVRVLETAKDANESPKIENGWIRKLYIEGHPLKNKKGIYWHDGRLDSSVKRMLERKRIIQEYIETGQ